MIKKYRGMLLAFLMVGLLGATPLYAQVEEVILRVDGLACPFCAFGLEKKCTKIPGVKSYDVDMKEGKVHIGMSGEEAVRLDRFRTAVKEAGFTLRDVYLRAKGTIEKTNTGFALALGPGRDRLLLFEKEAMGKKYHQGDDPKNLVLGQELARQLEEHIGSKEEVRIEGSVHEHEGLPAGLAVENFEALG